MQRTEGAKPDAATAVPAPTLESFVALLQSIAVSAGMGPDAALQLVERTAPIYNQVMEISPDAIIITDLELRVLLCNRQAAILHGYQAVEQMIGRGIVDAIAPEHRARARTNAARTVREGSIRDIKYSLLKADGTRIPAEVSASLIRDASGAPLAILGMVRDISERERAAKALRESEERYRILYQDNPTMYFTVDADGIVLSVNQFGAEQLGYAIEELVGRPVLGVFHEDDKEAVAGQFQTCLENPGRVWSWEFRKVRKDGRVIWVKEVARATLDVDGGVIVLVVCEDISARRAMEEELQRAREDLERKVESQMHGDGAYGLTFRELTVLHLVAAGSSDKEIATALGISPLTVSKHVANILGKMQASSRSEASARAVRESLVE